MFLTLLTAITQVATASPQAFHGRSGELNATVPRIENRAVVDGVLNETVWQSATVLTGFSQYRPVDGRPAEDSTHVLVWYAPEAIYFGIRAFEAHGLVVRATLSDRDKIDQDDRIEILLDAFNDRRRALMFAVNPFGIQQDGVRSEGQAGAAGGPGSGGRFDGVIDINPDFVYESRGRLTEDGYEVEVRIPFKSIRFQSIDPQDWGLQVVRVTQHNGYENTWTPAVRASASFLGQSGTVEGITGIERGLVLTANPELTTRVNGAPGATGYSYDTDPQLGGTVSWGLTTNLSINGTANPDFSQVEADVGQVTANERFALFFPEKRPFFLEGLEQFDSPNALIYTRRVVAPLAGVKLTGKAGRTNVGYLFAVDDRDFSADNAHPLVNLLRVRRDLGASSTLGLVYTDRQDGGHFNRVAAADARLIWGGIWFSEVQVATSWTRDGLGTRNGALWQLTLFDRTGRSYGNHGEIKGLSEDFASQSGFVPRTGVVQGNFFNRFTWYGAPGALVEQVTTFFGPQATWSHRSFFDEGGFLEGTFSNDWFATLRGGWSVGMNWRHARTDFDAAFYDEFGVESLPDTLAFTVPDGVNDLWSIGANFSTPNRALTLNGSARYGSTAVFAEPTRGLSLDAQLELQWKPTPAIRIDGRWVHQRIRRGRDRTRFSVANIPRIKLEYQVSRSVFVRYVGQYFAQERDALRDPRTEQPIVYGAGTAARLGPAAGSINNEFRSDILFSYRPGPGTVVFLGYGSTLEETAAFRFNGLTRRDDGFFAKVSYLFRTR